MVRFIRNISIVPESFKRNHEFQMISLITLMCLIFAIAHALMPINNTCASQCALQLQLANNTIDRLVIENDNYRNAMKSKEQLVFEMIDKNVLIAKLKNEIHALNKEIQYNQKIKKFNEEITRLDLHRLQRIVTNYQEIFAAVVTIISIIGFTLVCNFIANLIELVCKQKNHIRSLNM